MPLATPQEGIEIVCKWEGWHKALPDGRAKPYKCPAGVWTIGYGSTYWDDGRRIQASDDAITKEVGKQLLLRQLQNYANTVDRAIKVPVHPQMRAAMISLCYNIGTAAFAKSTLARRVNAKDWAACPTAFKMWRNGGGRVLTGLLNRRIDEAGLFMRGVAQLGTVATPSPAGIKLAATPVDSGSSWWQQIVKGILDGLGGRGTPAPA